MVELIKDASNSIFTKKSHKEGFLKSGHIWLPEKHLCQSLHVLLGIAPVGR